MALKFEVSIFIFAVLLTILSHQVAAGEHEQPKRIHTVHHHHVKKYPVYKKIEVPVVKEVKVPFKVLVPFKAPYPVVVKPYIVKVPVEYYPVHSSEHQHHGGHDGSHSYGHDGGHSYGHDGGHGKY